MTKLEYCLNHCPHEKESCGNRPCEEYLQRFSKRKRYKKKTPNAACRHASETGMSKGKCGA